MKMTFCEGFDVEVKNESALRTYLLNKISEFGKNRSKARIGYELGLIDGKIAVLKDFLEILRIAEKGRKDGNNNKKVNR